MSLYTESAIDIFFDIMPTLLPTRTTDYGEATYLALLLYK